MLHPQRNNSQRHRQMPEIEPAPTASEAQHVAFAMPEAGHCSASMRVGTHRPHLSSTSSYTVEPSSPQIEKKASNRSTSSAPFCEPFESQVTHCAHATAEKLEAMPAHWHLPRWKGLPPIFSDVMACALKTFTLVAFGHTSLAHVWECCEPNVEEEVWNAHKERLQRRHENIVVTGGLLLAAISAFLTTPPPAPDLLVYTTAGPYICLLASLGADLCGLIVGSAMLFIMAKCHMEWFRDSLMGSRSCLYCALILMSYPFIAIGLATVVLIISLVAAATHSPNPVIKTGALFMIISPISLIFIFAWTQISSILRRTTVRPQSSEISADGDKECVAV